MLPDVACVSVWMLLGAVLNPNTFLPFAMGVVTVGGFIIARVEYVRRTTAELEARLVGFVENHLGKEVTSALETGVLDPLSEGRAPSIHEVRRASRFESIAWPHSWLAWHHLLATACVQRCCAGAIFTARWNGARPGS